MRACHLVFVSSLLLAAACSGSSGGSDATTAPTVKANVTYQGVFTSGVERGTVSLTSGSPATGSLKVGNDAAVSLTGTFTTATSSFAMTGGGYTVNASAGSGGTIAGTVSGTNISGTATMAAVDATTGAPARYCGIFTGNDAGMVELYFLGGTAVAAVSGMPSGYVLNGTATSSSATLSATNPQKTNTVTLNVSFNGSTLTGSATSTAYPNDRVTVSASTAACASGTAPTPTAASTYIGYAWNNGATGLVTINTGATPSGSIAWKGGAAVALSGTYNATSGAVALTGGGLTLTGTTTLTSFSGTVSGMSGSVNTAGVQAMASPSNAPVTRYCGTVGSPAGGSLILTESAGSVKGVYVYGTSSGGLSGTFFGNMAYFTWGTKVFFAGTSAAGGYAGTYSHVDYNAGSWSISGC